jgi:hypothetical protein
MCDFFNTFRTLEGGVNECDGVVKKYWNSLLEKNDPEVNHEQIADGLLWLQHWTSAFFLATTNIIKATANSEKDGTPQTKTTHP